MSRHRFVGVTLFSLVEIYQTLEEICCLHFHDDKFGMYTNELVVFI